MNAEILIPDIYKKYDYNTFAQFWEDLFHDTNFNGIVFFCLREKDNHFKNMLFCNRSKVFQSLKDMSITPVRDYYYTASQFRAVKGKGIARKKENFFATCATVVDVDFHCTKTNEHLREGALNEYKGKVDALISLGEMFPYNYIINTGRGLQFIYIYEKCIPFPIEFIHNRVQELLIRQHEQIATDNPSLKVSVDVGASKKTTGLFRMPGTYNTKVHKGFYTTCEKSGYAYLDTFKIIDTYGLCDEPIPLLPHTPKTYDIAPKFQETGNRRGNHNHKIISAIYEYQRLKMAEQLNPGHENRTCTCFMLSHQLLAVMPYGDALNELSTFNRSFREPLPQKRLEQILWYCYQNYLDESKYRMQHIKNSTILNYLGLEDGSFGIYDTSSPDYRPNPDAKSNKERAIAREQREKRNLSIVEDFKSGMAYKDIAAKENVSIKIVYRIIKKMVPKETPSQKPWEKLGISKSTYYRRKKK